MSSAMAWEMQNIDIRTRSVEKVLIPLIAQVGLQLVFLSNERFSKQTIVQKQELRNKLSIFIICFW